MEDYPFFKQGIRFYFKEKSSGQMQYIPRYRLEQLKQIKEDLALLTNSYYDFITWLKTVNLPPFIFDSHPFSHIYGSHLFEARIADGKGHMIIDKDGKINVMKSDEKIKEEFALARDFLRRGGFGNLRNDELNDND